MGILTGGAFDPFNGKVGNLVGSTWKGINVLKRKPTTKRNRKQSEAQLDLQAKFAVAGEILHQLTPLLNITYKKYTKEHSIIGIYPNYQIDWSKLLISRGSLPHANGVTVTAGSGTVTFEWEETGIQLPALTSDKSILVIYCPELNEFAYTWTGATRMMGGASINVSSFVGRVVHTWLSFISDDGKRVTKSKYTGQLTL
jgi:hypothetical protein